MRRAKSDGLRPEVGKLRDQIERWRKTRTKRTRMPETVAARWRAEPVRRQDPFHEVAPEGDAQIAPHVLAEVDEGALPNVCRHRVRPGCAAFQRRPPPSTPAARLHWRWQCQQAAHGASL